MAMSSSSSFDQPNNDYYSQPRGFLTPPPTWKTSRCSPAMARSEKKPKANLFHIIHKIPSGDSPYVRAKHVQLVDKDPSRAVSLFWAAINSGDRVDSALKDMAVVMKQLDRSDEAIEAIKSFRHLSTPDSQDSLDNILVELYKQSGRIEEEIEMLQRKLKQVEVKAFSGKRVKIARSQGKKVQVTVEKEYSRLLGNLAWAYMQQKDFKSAEEHYRKALSFESDKNKQCNLAICLMHLNKLTEAKFLLQTVRFSSGYDGMDETYAKSYERASEMLAEFESQKKTEQENKTTPFGGQWDGMQSSPLPSLSVKMSNGSFTELPYEKRADFNWRRNHSEPHMGQEEASEFSQFSRNIPKVPFTQPRRYSRSGDQRKKGGWLTENAYRSYCRKLSFGSSTGSEQSLVNQTANYYCTALPSEMPNIIPHFSEKPDGNWRWNSSVKPLEEADEERTKSLAYNFHNSSTVECALPSDEENVNLQAVCGETCPNPTCIHKKSWADMVEEDEQELFGRKGFNDENVDSNIMHETPRSHDKAENLCQKMELVDLGSGYFSQPEKTTLPTTQPPVRRSLCFDQNVLNFEGQVEGLSEDLSSSNSGNRKRLKVFQDITCIPESPRP